MVVGVTVISYSPHRVISSEMGTLMRPVWLCAPLNSIAIITQTSIPLILPVSHFVEVPKVSSVTLLTGGLGNFGIGGLRGLGSFGVLNSLSLSHLCRGNGELNCLGSFRAYISLYLNHLCRGVSSRLFLLRVSQLFRPCSHSVCLGPGVVQKGDAHLGTSSFSPRRDGLGSRRMGPR